MGKIRYNIYTGAKRIKTKISIVLSTLGLGIAGLAIPLGLSPAFAGADSHNINFESPTYSIGNINGQDGWTKTGPYDVAVAANSYGYGSFGGQSLRMSDAVTSGSFGDQTFAKPLSDSAGETASTAGTFSVGTKQNHFETQFDIASTMQTVQPGMHTSVSPDRGDGSRMSYLRFEDGTGGINVFFDDVQQPTPCTPLGCANFVETQVGTNLTRTVPHTIKLTMDFLDGPGNDIVKVYIDGSLVHTGTSWEDYYRFDPEAAAEQSPRIVKTVLFRESGGANLADLGKGFLFDNLSLSSSMTPPTSKDQCKNNGWKVFNNPSFKNQGQCIDFVEHNQNDKDHQDNDNDSDHGHHGDDSHHDDSDRHHQPED